MIFLEHAINLTNSNCYRIVIVSSTLHEQGAINFDDLNLKAATEDAKNGKSSGRHNIAYNNSKLMNVYFARSLADKLNDYGVDVHACCPGFTYTNLFRYLFFIYLALNYILVYKKK